MNKPCPQKHRYESGAVAFRCAISVTRKCGWRARAYSCTYCGGWHLTGTPRKWKKDEWIRGLA